MSENQQNWLDCIKSGGEPNANIDIAARTAIACHLANIATRLQRTLRFDPAAERIIGDKEANSLLGRTYRKKAIGGFPQMFSPVSRKSIHAKLGKDFGGFMVIRRLQICLVATLIALSIVSYSPAKKAGEAGGASS